MDDGYLFFQVNPIEKRVDNDSIDLEIKIYEGKQARIKNINVTGNTKTSDHVIIRDMYTWNDQNIRQFKHSTTIRRFEHSTIRIIIQYSTI